MTPLLALAIHKNAILRETIYPAELNDKVSKKATQIAIQIANEINLNGILAVEMFLMKNETKNKK